MRPGLASSQLLHSAWHGLDSNTIFLACDTHTLSAGTVVFHYHHLHAATAGSEPMPWQHTGAATISSSPATAELAATVWWLSGVKSAFHARPRLLAKVATGGPGCRGEQRLCMQSRLVDPAPCTLRPPWLRAQPHLRDCDGQTSHHEPSCHVTTPACMRQAGRQAAVVPAGRLLCAAAISACRSDDPPARRPRLRNTLVGTICALTRSKPQVRSHTPAETSRSAWGRAPGEHATSGHHVADRRDVRMRAGTAYKPHTHTAPAECRVRICRVPRPHAAAARHHQPARSDRTGMHARSRPPNRTGRQPCRGPPRPAAARARTHTCRPAAGSVVGKMHGMGQHQAASSIRPPSRGTRVGGTQYTSWQKRHGTFLQYSSQSLPYFFLHASSSRISRWMSSTKK